MKAFQEWYNRNTIGQRILIWITSCILTLACFAAANAGAFFVGPFGIVIPGLVIYLELGRKAGSDISDIDDDTN